MSKFGEGHFSRIVGVDPFKNLVPVAAGPVPLLGVGVESADGPS
tara:strand:- start:268 stop:399 length:132 start_codon:yes stop_codon:yes gene_type:complete